MKCRDGALEGARRRRREQAARGHFAARETAKARRMHGSSFFRM
jgi:hypothetical protein